MSAENNDKSTGFAVFGLIILAAITGITFAVRPQSEIARRVETAEPQQTTNTRPVLIELQYSKCELKKNSVVKKDQVGTRFYELRKMPHGATLPSTVLAGRRVWCDVPQNTMLLDAMFEGLPFAPDPWAQHSTVELNNWTDLSTPAAKKAIEKADRIERARCAGEHAAK